MNNKLKGVIFIAAIAILAAGSFWFLKKKNDAHKVSVITSADRVEVFRIDAYNSRRRTSEYIDVHPVISKSSITDTKSKKQLTQFLQPYFRDQSYRPDMTKCVPNPGLAFHVWQGENYLEIVMCISCELLTFGDQRGWRDFSEDRPLIVGIAKQAFPQDKVVQALSEKESTYSDYKFEHDF